MAPAISSSCRIHALWLTRNVDRRSHDRDRKVAKDLDLFLGSVCRFHVFPKRLGCRQALDLDHNYSSPQMFSS